MHTGKAMRGGCLTYATMDSWRASQPPHDRMMPATAALISVSWLSAGGWRGACYACMAPLPPGLAADTCNENDKAKAAGAEPARAPAG